METIKNRFGDDRPIERRDGAPHAVRTGWKEANDLLGIEVHFGLHYMRGNHAPYFTLTISSGRRNGRDEFGGADHETIVRELPELADLAALHLSDIDGVPMHAEANGWYWLAGACGGFGERYHGANAENVKSDPLDIFADHCRITRAEAEALRDKLVAHDATRGELPIGKLARERWREYCESCRPRWKEEAQVAIAKYELTVHGERWPPAKKEVTA